MQYPLVDKKRTAEHIKFFMRYNCLKPTDIQKYLGLTCVQTVYRWLDGINIPSIDNLYAFSQLFRVKVDDMLAGNRKIISPYIAYKSLGMTETIAGLCKKYCGAVAVSWYRSEYTERTFSSTFLSGIYQCYCVPIA